MGNSSSPAQKHGHPGVITVNEVEKVDIEDTEELQSLRSIPQATPVLSNPHDPSAPRGMDLPGISSRGLTQLNHTLREYFTELAVDLDCKQVTVQSREQEVHELIANIKAKVKRRDKELGKLNKEVDTLTSLQAQIAELESSMQHAVAQCNNLWKHLPSDVSLPPFSSTDHKLRVVYEGKLWRQGQRLKQWKTRWYVLTSDGLLSYYLNQEDDAVRGVISVRDATEIAATAQDTFVVKSSDRTHHFRCDEDSAGIDEWLSAITSLEFMKDRQRQMHCTGVMSHTIQENLRTMDCGDLSVPSRVLCWDEHIVFVNERDIIMFQNDVKIILCHSHAFVQCLCLSTMKDAIYFCAGNALFYLPLPTGLETDYGKWTNEPIRITLQLKNGSCIGTIEDVVCFSSSTATKTSMINSKHSNSTDGLGDSDDGNMMEEKQNLTENLLMCDSQSSLLWMVQMPNGTCHKIGHISNASSMSLGDNDVYITSLNNGIFRVSLSSCMQSFFELEAKLSNPTAPTKSHGKYLCDVTQLPVFEDSALLCCEFVGDWNCVVVLSDNSQSYAVDLNGFELSYLGAIEGARHVRWNGRRDELMFCCPLGAVVKVLPKASLILVSRESRYTLDPDTPDWRAVTTTTPVASPPPVEISSPRSTLSSTKSPRRMSTNSMRSNTSFPHRDNLRRQDSASSVPVSPVSSDNGLHRTSRSSNPSSGNPNNSSSDGTIPSKLGLNSSPPITNASSGGSSPSPHPGAFAQHSQSASPYMVAKSRRKSSKTRSIPSNPGMFLRGSPSPSLQSIQKVTTKLRRESPSSRAATPSSLHDSNSSPALLSDATEGQNSASRSGFFSQTPSTPPTKKSKRRSFPHHIGLVRKNDKAEHGLELIAQVPYIVQSYDLSELRRRATPLLTTEKTDFVFLIKFRNPNRGTFYDRAAAQDIYRKLESQAESSIPISSIIQHTTHGPVVFVEFRENLRDSEDIPSQSLR